MESSNGRKIHILSDQEQFHRFFDEALRPRLDVLYRPGNLVPKSAFR